MIEIKSLSKVYGQFRALDDVSLFVEEGEFIALLGPSGCGKTTLLRSIAGFVQPDGGSISISGRSMLGQPPNKRPVNTVFQNYALFPHYSVANNVAFGPRRQRLPVQEIKQRVQEALTAVGMSDFASRFPSQLSGGQQQRVALARAIVNRPKVLLLDEPLGALDLKLRKQLQLELSKLHKTLGITFIFVTHDQEEALVMADRVAVMSRGKILQLGKPDEIYDHPSSRYVASFVGESTLLRCDVGQDGRVVLEANGAVLPAQLAGIWRNGQSLMIRPENIAVGPAVGPDETAVEGVVASVAFLGSTRRVHLELANREVAIVDIPGTGPKPELGQALTVHWHGAKATFVSD
ncbi:ABC transporter ATP-binding protein [Mesorhizobium sp. MSK_1335]|uniref:Spermidine/putrescine import ATP-binding protein PotA n=1 Tax=Mesorhizobium montanum TaxID=3072323 RepID=A0ABU4ZXN7_9HYPH|nr:ABC transporter ATP-binding protein [Mesorhizobium sp. MSK_1335]MDX8529197.1 ABC transporter ATP-binding protein [Mesorhizobium sp. MSK_1335]